MDLPRRSLELGGDRGPSIATRGMLLEAHKAEVRREILAGQMLHEYYLIDRDLEVQRATGLRAIRVINTMRSFSNAIAPLLALALENPSSGPIDVDPRVYMAAGNAVGASMGGVTRARAENVSTQQQGGLQNMTEAGIKRKATNQKERTCLTCHVTSSGQEACDSHLNGKRHKSKIASGNAQEKALEIDCDSSVENNVVKLNVYTADQVGTTSTTDVLEHTKAKEEKAIAKLVDVSKASDECLERPSSKIIEANRYVVTEVYKEDGKASKKRDREKKRHFWCKLCELSITSEKSLVFHLEGKKHKARFMKHNLEAQIKTTEVTSASVMKKVVGDGKCPVNTIMDKTSEVNEKRYVDYITNHREMSNKITTDGSANQILVGEYRKAKNQEILMDAAFSEQADKIMQEDQGGSTAKKQDTTVKGDPQIMNKLGTKWKMVDTHKVLSSPSQKEWTCLICDVTAYSQECFDIHLNGKRHKYKITSGHAQEKTLEMDRGSLVAENIVKLDMPAVDQLDANSTTALLEHVKAKEEKATAKLVHVSKTSGECLERPSLEIFEANRSVVIEMDVEDGNDSKKRNAGKRIFWCKLCELASTNEKSLVIHLEGKKHKARFRRHNSEAHITTFGLITASVTKKITGEKSPIKTTMDKTCEVREKRNDDSITSHSEMANETATNVSANQILESGDERATNQESLMAVASVGGVMLHEQADQIMPDNQGGCMTMKHETTVMVCPITPSNNNIKGISAGAKSMSRLTNGDEDDIVDKLVAGENGMNMIFYKEASNMGVTIKSTCNIVDGVEGAENGGSKMNEDGVSVKFGEKTDEVMEEANKSSTLNEDKLKDGIVSSGLTVHRLNGRFEGADYLESLMQGDKVDEGEYKIWEGGNQKSTFGVTGASENLITTGSTDVLLNCKGKEAGDMGSSENHDTPNRSKYGLMVCGIMEDGCGESTIHDRNTDHIVAGIGDTCEALQSFMTTDKFDRPESSKKEDITMDVENPKSRENDGKAGNVIITIGSTDPNIKGKIEGTGNLENLLDDKAAEVKYCEKAGEVLEQAHVENITKQMQDAGKAISVGPTDGSMIEEAENLHNSAKIDMLK